MAALNLESREGKILFAMVQESYRNSGITSLKDPKLREIKSKIEDLNKRYGLDLNIEEVFEVMRKAMEMALKMHIEESLAIIAKGKK